MKKILHIIASPRGEQSRTLKISGRLIDNLKTKYSGVEVDVLNLFTADLPDLTVTRVKGKYMLLSGQPLTEEAEKSWQEIKEHISRFLSADMIVVSTPMWNFSLPYKLKQYIDIIVQPGFTFQYVENGVEGLAAGKKMVVVSTHGGDYGESSPMQSYDQLTPYLKQVFGFIGLTDLEMISAQPMDAGGEEVREKKIAQALQKVDELTQKL
ncbi:MAG: FMN-dependent NADH-azoreductase [Clostridiales bacterium]|jgi:FMN-dependent NADH-azoreductase|nr:FMN-dependent NADH-azoreductase [Clostridiales bacterium]MDN5281315.1 FMN-dependent NADH-azoreductase [Candidatus Ozemobacter sp.]